MSEKQRTSLIIILVSIVGVLITGILAVFVIPFALMIMIWGGMANWMMRRKSLRL